MSLDKLKPETQRALAIAVPVVVVLIAAFLIIPKLEAIWTVQRQAEARRAEAALRKQQNQSELAAESKERLPACPESKDEALIFLRELSRVVAISQVKLVSYRPPAAIGPRWSSRWRRRSRSPARMATWWRCSRRWPPGSGSTPWMIFRCGRTPTRG
jgi:hypothetical protein